MALLALPFVFSPAVARAAETLKVDAAESGCPRRRDVMAALEARLPGLDRWTISSVTIRRLQLSPAETPDAVLLRLWDDRGGVALERRLALEPGAGGRGRAARDRASCQALAEAAALVAVRYLREIGYRPPAASVPDPSPAAEPSAPTIEPPPPPPSTPVAPPAAAAAAPRPAATVAARVSPPTPAPAATAGYLGVGGGLRLGSGDSALGRGEAVVSLHLHARLLALSVGAGASSESVVDVTGGAPAELRLRAFPLRLGLALPVQLGGGALLPTLALSADLLSFRAVGLADARQGLRFDPAAEAGLAYLAQGRLLYLRVSGMAGLTLAPRDFQAGAETTYRTPGAYFRAQLEMGVRLWKNSTAAAL
jgi:hypothetical protein